MSLSRPLRVDVVEMLCLPPQNKGQGRSLPSFQRAGGQQRSQNSPEAYNKNSGSGPRTHFQARSSLLREMLEPAPLFQGGQTTVPSRPRFGRRPAAILGFLCFINLNSALRGVSPVI